MPVLTPELLAILGILGVHLLPKILLRARIPAPVTALAIGMIVAVFLPALDKNPTLYILSTLGISALFLSAGLAVDARELGAKPAVLISTLATHAALLTALGIFGGLVLHLDTKSAMLFSLAVGTPSGGFILDGLAGLRARPDERRAIHDSALVCELLSLVVFFFVMQSSSVTSLLKGLLAVALLLGLVPLVLRHLARAILPYAPNSEFTLVVLTAVCCAYATRQIGIYYLLGAFAVGAVARRLEDEVPELATEKNRQAVELFGTFFAPFYFAHAGLEIDATTISLRALGLALALLALLVPLRIGLVLLTRRLLDGASTRAATRVGAALVPTFVFSLVMAQMLHATEAPPWLAGGLVLFAILNAFVPQSVFARVAPDPEPPPANPAPESPPNAAPSDAAPVPGDPSPEAAATPPTTAAPEIPPAAPREPE